MDAKKIAQFLVNLRISQEKIEPAILKDHSKASGLQEEIANAAGGGHIAGIGIGPHGEPGRPGKLMRRQKIFGVEAFVVNSDYFHKCRMGKKKYLRYEKYVGGDDIGEEIRMYGRNPKTCNEAIIVMDEKTGQMCYLKYPKYR